MSEQRYQLWCRFVLLLCFVWSGADAAAESVTAAQRRAAMDYLEAVASANPQQIAFAIHPEELDRLRLDVQKRLREEALRNESAARGRLFGDAVSLVEIERLTSVNFFRAVARQVELPTPRPDELRAIGAVRDGKLVHVLLRGNTGAPLLVSVLPYGREWKAALPAEFATRVEELLLGREEPASIVQRSVAASPSVQTSLPPILELLEAAESALVAGRCDRYYQEYLSPTLQRGLGKRALETLITSCSRSIATRELLIAALRVVRRTPPVYDPTGRRASYDVSGQGLPFDRFLLEEERGRWYIAE